MRGGGGNFKANLKFDNIMILDTNERFTVVRPENLQGWLRERTGGIGASELSSILGLNKYCTPLQYYAKKQNEIECAPIVEIEIGRAHV